jgi:hypothetical protein
MFDNLTATRSTKGDLCLFSGSVLVATVSSR